MFTIEILLNIRFLLRHVLHLLSFILSMTRCIFVSLPVLRSAFYIICNFNLYNICVCVYVTVFSCVVVCVYYDGSLNAYNYVSFNYFPSVPPLATYLMEIQ